MWLPLFEKGKGREKRYIEVYISERGQRINVETYFLSLKINFISLYLLLFLGFFQVK